MKKGQQAHAEMRRYSVQGYIEENDRALAVREIISQPDATEAQHDLRIIYC